MYKRSLLWSLNVGLLAVAFFVGTLRGTGADIPDADQERLLAALLPTDTNGLLNFFRLRAQGKPSPETLHQLIETLHAPGLAERQHACADLVAIGTPALPSLHAAAKDNDPLTNNLARLCLAAIELDDGTLIPAAARLLARRHPPEAAGILLAYLPRAENETVLEELKESLDAVAYDAKGKADPAIVKALSDSQPLQRATAVMALTHGNWMPYRDTYRKLLKDPSASVRLQAALALAQTSDAEALPTLIALLSDLADPQGRDAIEDFLTDLAGERGPKVPSGEDEASRRKARDAWAKWWQNIDDASLLNELKKRTIADVDRDKLQPLIRKLGDEAFPVRQKAEEELTRLGRSMLSLLKSEAKKDNDPEVRHRLEHCVEMIETEKVKDKTSSLLPSLARLIALRKPAGAAEVLLAYMPSLEDDGLIGEMQNALNAVAFVENKPQPVVVRALTDKQAMRRAAAACALCAGGRSDQVALVRPLLNDADPAVRQKAALALAGSRESVAVPTLIALMAELPADKAQKVEDYLNRLARDNQPKDLAAGDTKEARKKRSEIWSKWWEDNKNAVVLVDPFAASHELSGSLLRARSTRGYTMLVQTQSNTVTELGPDGKPLWTLTDLSSPVDAQVLSGQRVLVAEQDKVTERNLQGKILWQKDVPQPVNAQRLRNGNTFIVTPSLVIEVDRSGKEVMRVDRGFNTARKLPNGQIVGYEGSQLIQLDEKGREIKSSPIQAGGAGCNEILDNGHALISSPGNGNLIEFNTDGQEVNRFNINGTVHGFRLPNGHTLLTVGGDKYLELDEKWQQIKETNLATPAFRVKGR